MKFRSLLLLLASFATAMAQIPSDNPRVFWDGGVIPNPKLRAYLLEHYDTDKNGIISKKEARAVDRIELGMDLPEEDEVTGADAHSLMGIERFRNLTYLSCRVNRFTSVDLSKNKSLRYVDVGNHYKRTTGRITSLRLPRTRTLEEVYCDCNDLTSLDLPKCPNLRVLVCYRNELTSLDLSKFPDLRALYCGRNELTTLDLSHNPKLDTLECGWNSLASLDVSRQSALKYLGCSGNWLSELDLTANRALEALHCTSNLLSSLRAPSSLVWLTIGSPMLPTFDFSKFPSLKHLRADNMVSLDLSKNPALESLTLFECKFDKLDLSHNPEMRRIKAPSMYENQIWYVDLRHIKNLEELHLPAYTTYLCSDDEYDWSGNAAALKAGGGSKNAPRRPRPNNRRGSGVRMPGSSPCRNAGRPAPSGRIGWTPPAKRSKPAP